MALFGKRENAEEKQQKELEKFKARYGLEDLNPQDLAVVQRVAQDLLANNIFKAGHSASPKPKNRPGSLSKRLSRAELGYYEPKG